MKRNKLTYFFTATAILISTLPIGASPADSKPARRSLQSLPNGTYLYGTARLPRQRGAEYRLIRKNGRYFVEYAYAYQSDSSCMSGTIRGNTLNQTQKFDSDDSERGVYETKNFLNLNQYYQFSSRYISAEDREGIQGCINIMSR